MVTFEGKNPQTVKIMNYKPSANSAVHPSKVGIWVPRVFILEYEFCGQKLQVHISCKIAKNPDLHWQMIMLACLHTHQEQESG